MRPLEPSPKWRIMQTHPASKSAHVIIIENYERYRLVQPYPKARIMQNKQKDGKLISGD